MKRIATIIALILIASMATPTLANNSPEYDRGVRYLKSYFERDKNFSTIIGIYDAALKFSFNGLSPAPFTTAESLLNYYARIYKVGDEIPELSLFQQDELARMSALTSILVEHYIDDDAGDISFYVGHITRESGYSLPSIIGLVIYLTNTTRNLPSIIGYEIFDIYRWGSDKGFSIEDIALYYVLFNRENLDFSVFTDVIDSFGYRAAFEKNSFKDSLNSIMNAPSYTEAYNIAKKHYVTDSKQSYITTKQLGQITAALYQNSETLAKLKKEITDAMK